MRSLRGAVLLPGVGPFGVVRHLLADNAFTQRWILAMREVSALRGCKEGVQEQGALGTALGTNMKMLRMDRRLESSEST